MEEKDGGKNRGEYKNLVSQTDAQLLRSIRSYARNAEEHADKLRAPHEYVGDWAALDGRHKKGIKGYWLKEIAQYAEKQAIAEAIARERGIVDEQ
ncbi:MAG: hypothetical protein LBI44_06105 [Oscillospiraceae bacterium]|jgi:hypothetical protein|nr:hypothetical protein [Oscillospiraceae bacterium]